MLDVRLWRNRDGQIPLTVVECRGQPDRKPHESRIRMERSRRRNWNWNSGNFRTFGSVGLSAPRKHTPWPSREELPASVKRVASQGPLRRGLFSTPAHRGRRCVFFKWRIRNWLVPRMQGRGESGINLNALQNGKSGILALSSRGSTHCRR